jgi:hypothetical protein
LRAVRFGELLSCDVIKETPHILDLSSGKITR